MRLPKLTKNAHDILPIADEPLHSFISLRQCILLLLDDLLRLAVHNIRDFRQCLCYWKGKHVQYLAAQSRGADVGQVGEEKAKDYGLREERPAKGVIC